MVKAIRQEITVQRDNVIEIHSLALKSGAHVEVILLLQDEQPPLKKHLLSLLGKGKGSFSSPEEADSFIRRERNKWE
jgi:hypothetical protein